MRIIDGHTHFSNIAVFHDAAALAGADYSAAGLKAEAGACGVTGHICMGLEESAPGRFPDSETGPVMGADLDNMPDNMRLCLGINPHKAARLEEYIDERTAGFKIYAGYYHLDILDDAYAPVYKLALERALPVVFHSGDTFSPRGLLAYSHPLNIDRLAVRYPELRVVICHMGFPWVMDACEAAYKNRNVFIDTSGLAVGGRDEVRRFMNSELMLNLFRQGLMFLNDYEKVIFGSDWPLAPLAEYIELIKLLIPQSEWGAVFRGNAERVYGIS